uniref:Formimidoyltransferase-cyclodeaminase n=1 Tax=Bos mutus grunniens TaxID=30521 RepID=A0A8B9W304_BOSMU
MNILPDPSACSQLLWVDNGFFWGIRAWAVGVGPALPLGGQRRVPAHTECPSGTTHTHSTGHRDGGCQQDGAAGTGSCNARHRGPDLPGPFAVYLYGEAARMTSRQSLPAIRAGEYEALPEKLKQAEWAPDFGPSSFIPSWGATATGARKFLLAFNINLLSTKEQAHRIALNLREQGRGKDQPGRLSKVQGIGWYLDEKNLAQVSMNLLDFEVTGLHTVYEETCREAQELSLPVVGSQLVGLVPLKALLDAATFYCEQENLFLLEEEQRLRLVVNRLGLDSLSPFNPKERIIEYLVPQDGPEQSLVDQPLRAFIRAVGARSAAPGGGSVAAASAAMGAALASMAGLMTYGRRQFEHLDMTMRRLIPPFRAAVAELTAMVDADARAFEAYLKATKLPKNTPEDKDRRAAALQEGLRQAVAVPLALAETVASLWPALRELALCVNLACRSDLQVAAKALETGVFGAYFNVLINLKDVTDDVFKDQVHRRISSLLQDAQTQAALVLDGLEARQE